MPLRLSDGCGLKLKNPATNQCTARFTPLASDHSHNRNVRRIPHKIHYQAKLCEKHQTAYCRNEAGINCSRSTGNCGSSRFFFFSWEYNCTKVTLLSSIRQMYTFTHNLLATSNRPGDLEATKVQIWLQGKVFSLSFEIAPPLSPAGD